MHLHANCIACAHRHAHNKESRCCMALPFQLSHASTYRVFRFQHARTRVLCFACFAVLGISALKSEHVGVATNELCSHSRQLCDAMASALR
jgi:hypothetical protein